MIPILSFFTIYYDYRKYNNSGKATSNSIEISVCYSYSKNNRKYNPNWIAQEFGQQTSNEFEQMLAKLNQQGAVQAKKRLKIMGIFFLIIIFGAVLLLSLLNYISS